MILRQIQAHRFRVLAVRDPVEGDEVLAVLNDAKKFHERLFLQMTAALREHAPTYGPPFSETRYGVASAKRLYDGLSEFTAQNQEPSRRERARQARDEKNLGLRVFFFEYGRDIICTNACYKTQPTPEGAIPAAFQVRETYFIALAGGDVQIITGG
jgi:hypothetical protein